MGRCRAILTSNGPTPLCSSACTLAPLLVFTGLIVLSAGCSADSVQPGEPSSAKAGSSLSVNHLPIIQSVRIQPDPIVLNRPVSAVTQGHDADGDLITFRHQWKVNGQIVEGATHDIFEWHGLKRGDHVSVDVTPYDGHTAGAVAHTDAIVGNTPPDIKELVLGPEEPKRGDIVRATLSAFDPDGDPIHYRYRWFRNESEVADGEEDALATAEFSRGDVIFVEVTPFDETTKGKARVSGPVVI